MLVAIGLLVAPQMAVAEPPDGKGKPESSADDLDCDGCVDEADIADGAVTDAKVAGGLAASKVSGALDAATIAGSDITGTIAGDIISSGIDAANITTGQLDGSRIASLSASKLTGILDPSRLGTNSLTGDKLALASDQALDSSTTASGIQNEHIEPATIAGDRLAPGTVGTGELQTGAVTSDKTSPNTARTNRFAIQTATSTAVLWPDPAAELTTGSGSHRVLVTGQLEVRCTGCTDGGHLEYLLVRVFPNGATTSLAPLYRVEFPPIASGNAIQVGSASALDLVNSATWRYQFQITGGTPGAGNVTFTRGVVNAIDLGREL